MAPIYRPCYQVPVNFDRCDQTGQVLVKLHVRGDRSVIDAYRKASWASCQLFWAHLPRQSTYGTHTYQLITHVKGRNSSFWRDGPPSPPTP